MDMTCSLCENPKPRLPAMGKIAQKPSQGFIYGCRNLGMAQLAEHRYFKPGVAGSSPATVSRNELFLMNGFQCIVHI